MSVTNNALQGAMAFQQAIQDAGNFVDQQMRSYGWTSPDASGKYTTLAAQDAFDPDRIIQFDAFGSPMVDSGALASAGAAGQYGTTGLFAQAAQRFATQEANVAAGERMRGFGRGSGLSSQRRQAVETASGEGMGQLSSQFLQSLLGQYQNVGRVYQGALAGQAQGAAQNAQRLAQYTSLYNY